MACPKEVIELVQRFRDHRESYHSPQYNETQVRREFVDPFFEALGWDVNNKRNDAEAYKEVIHEDSVRIGGFAKAPDYGFRFGGKRMFFVETKKPSVNINQDLGSAYQLRRYAWSAKLALGILTNFEEFAIYDCRKKPSVNDKASISRVRIIRFEDYEKEWEYISSIFTKSAIRKGAFDSYVTTVKGGTSEVDKEFLKQIEDWRNELAHNIANRNRNIGENELNYAVTKTIDRVIFLRICEDRGIEDQGALLGSINGPNIYPRLLKLFRDADDRYNSGLFHFKSEKEQHEQPDTITPQIKIDDDIFRTMIKDLYYPESPYEFSVLPADILGQVYEQFLGKIIRLTPGHLAKVDDKPQVKKAGGVYYTPTYIVDYIVKTTVGKLLEGKIPKQVEKLKILDPACGSGSFLIGAYQFLLDWHLHWYQADGFKKWTRVKKPPVEYNFRGEPRITSHKRREILTKNIFGVDIDAQAVEVTKLSLCLKVLEGESSDVLHSWNNIWHERALPDLGNNIRCGNSLVGTDYWGDNMTLFMDDAERMRINAFDWVVEFADIMKAGGFDAVIGNPPYVRQETLGEAFKTYAKVHFNTYAGTADLYTYFIEKGVALLKKGGRFGIIVANKWMRANYGEPLRKWLKTQQVEGIVDFGDLPVFQTATTYPCILMLGKDGPTRTFRATKIETLVFDDLATLVEDHNYIVNQTTLDDKGWSLADESVQGLLDKLKRRGAPLSEYVGGRIYYGVKTGFNEAFIVNGTTRDQLIAEDPKSADIIKPFLVGRDIKRYATPIVDKFLIFARHGTDVKNYPAIEKHLLRYRTRLQPKPKGWTAGEWKGRKPGAYQWWEIQDAVDYFEEFAKPKICWGNLAREAPFAIDSAGAYVNAPGCILTTSDTYLLGCINSMLLWWYLKIIAAERQGGFIEAKPIYVEQLPIISRKKANQIDSRFVNNISRNVEMMTGLSARIQEAKTPGEKTSLQRQIDATDRQIDQLVYELYGLTAEEIKIVEGVG